jgi:hypothetical protein
VPRQWKNLIGIGILIAIVSAVVYAGTSNRQSFLSDSFKVNFLPSAETRTGRPTYPDAAKGILAIQDFQFAEGEPDAVRRPAIFHPGEKVFLVFSVIGGRAKDEVVWIQEDLTVRYPDGNTGLKLENIIDFRERLERPGPIEMTNNVALPGDAMPGRYTVSIVLRDKHTGRQLNEQRFFYVAPKGVAPQKPSPPKGLN